jgi:hypothetical protein
MLRLGQTSSARAFVIKPSKPQRVAMTEVVTAFKKPRRFMDFPRSSSVLAQSSHSYSND